MTTSPTAHDVPGDFNQAAVEAGQVATGMRDEAGRQSDADAEINNPSYRATFTRPTIAEIGKSAARAAAESAK